jgi:hypothetical protein
MQLSTHAQKLERWLGGSEQLERISTGMKDWYGPPIPMQGVPGNVWAHKGGDFKGPITSGGFANGYDFFESRVKRIAKNWHMRQMRVANAGFASLADLVAEATQGGKLQQLAFQKAGATGVVAVTNSLWGLGNQPAAGANPAAAPGGEAPTKATTGCIGFTNASAFSGSDTMHFVSGYAVASVAGQSLLLYDRIFSVLKTMNSTATESVTGVPTRYQSTTQTDPDFAGGNFLFVEVLNTALAATGHNWTVCLYTDQDGNTGATLPSLTGNNAGIARRLDHPTSQWFAPLASGDIGIQQLDQMQCSAAVATGTIAFTIGHPLAWMPCPIINLACVVDGINSAFSMARVFDDAALAFLEVCKPATTATTYTGMITTVSG